jgi:hypothetical protein
MALMAGFRIQRETVYYKTITLNQTLSDKMYCFRPMRTTETMIGEMG